MKILRKDGIMSSKVGIVNPPTGCRYAPRCPKAMEICKKADPIEIEIEKDRFVACYLYA